MHLQADAVLRNLASRYSYDAPQADQHSLRGHIEEVAAQLKSELHQRMHQAGVEVTDARISYLTYATGNRRGHAAAPAGGSHHRRTRASSRAPSAWSSMLCKCSRKRTSSN